MEEYDSEFLYFSEIYYFFPFGFPDSNPEASRTREAAIKYVDFHPFFQVYYFLADSVLQLGYFFILDIPRSTSMYADIGFIGSFS